MLTAVLVRALALAIVTAALIGSITALAFHNQEVVQSHCLASKGAQR